MMLVGLPARRVGYRSKQFPKRGVGILYLQKMLELVRSEKQLTQIFASSPYRFKKSTLECLRWCVEKNLVERRERWVRKNKRPHVYYEITDNGRKLLELIV